MPPLSTAQIEQFVWRWCNTHQQELLPCVTLIATGVAPNPRGVKRTLHTLSLVIDTRKRAGLATPPDRLALLTKLVIIQISYEGVFREPAILYDLEQMSKNGDAIQPKQALAELLVRHPRLRDMAQTQPVLSSQPTGDRAIAQRPASLSQLR